VATRTCTSSRPYHPGPQDTFSLPALPAHPQPLGIDTPDVESLSGYLQRVAAMNHLPIFSLLAATGWVRRGGNSRPVNPDLCPWDLADLARVTRQSVETLEQMTLLPLYRVFYGVRLKHRAAVWQFFSNGHGPIFTNTRRYCPQCLRESLAYRLRWQCCEILVCLRHETLLVSACPACSRSSPILSRMSVLGRCLRCRRLLTETDPQEAPQKLVEHQRDLQRDYDQLFAGRIRFAVPADPENGTEGFLLRIEQIRMERGMTWRSFTMHCAVAPDSLLPTASKRPTFRTFLRLARHLSGSLEAFAQVPPASHRTPPRRLAIDLPCLNPWCADYQSSRAVFSKGWTYLCRTCGCSFSRHRQTLYTLPVESFYQCVHDACARLPARGDAWLAPFMAAGMSFRMRNFVWRRLVRSGIVAEHGRRWVMALRASARIHGYPLTPPLAMRARRRAFKLGDNPRVFNQRVQRALRSMVRHGQPVTLAALATRVNLSRNTLSFRLRAFGINVRKAMDTARQAVLAHRRRAEERAVRKALPGVVAQTIARGDRPSFAGLCRMVEISPARLKKRYPALAGTVLHAYRRARLTLARQRRHRLKAHILHIVRESEARGETPTYDRVVARLGIHFVGDPDLYSFFRKLRGGFPA
jgi:AraC-like DNA-binding protein